MPFDFPNTPSIGDTAQSPTWLYTWDGSKWVAAPYWLPLTGGMLTGPLQLVGDPTSNLQAATKQYVDSRVVAQSGVTSFNTRYGVVALTNLDVIAVLPGSSAAPLMNGTASAGTGAAWARSDHVHPSDTTNPVGYQTATQVSASINAALGPYSTTAATNAAYVSKAGDTMSGGLIVGGLGVSYAGSNWFRFYWDGSFANVGIDGSNVTYQIPSVPWCQGTFKAIGAYTPNQNVDYNNSPTFWDTHVNATLYATNGNANHQFSSGSFSGNLAVTGSLSISGGATFYATLQCSGARIISYGNNNNPSVTVWNAASGAGCMFYDVNGQLAFGNADGAGNPTSYRIYVDPSGNFSAGGSITAGTNINCTNGTIHINALQNNLAPQLFKFWWSSPGVYIRADGNDFGPIPSASDARIKQDIAPSKLDCLDVVKRIPLHEFRYRRLDIDTGEFREAAPSTRLVSVGLVTQTLAEVLPEAVHGDDTEAPAGGKMVIQSVNQSVMLAALVGAVQKLSQRLETLEGRT